MYDLIVIGAGAVGSATAYHAAKAGHRVLLLEQYAIDHQRGSSTAIRASSATPTIIRPTSS